MNYSEIVNYPRSYNPLEFPFIAHIIVEAECFSEVKQLIQDMTQAGVVGHDLEDDDLIVIHVACTSKKVKHRLESRWA